MEAAKWSVTSLIYCLMFGLIFWASLLVYFLSAQSGQEVYSEDWLQQYLRRCFSPILSLVLTVFRVTAGNYRLTRLRPNIHSFSLCLSFLILGTKLFLDFSDKLCSFKMSAHLRYKVNGSVWFQQCTMTENFFHCLHFFFFFLTSWAGWWIIPWDSYLKHDKVNGANAVCLLYAGFTFAAKAWLSPTSSQFDRGEL